MTDFPQFYLQAQSWQASEEIFKAVLDWFDQLPWNVLHYSGPNIDDIFRRTGVFDVVYSLEYLGPITNNPFLVGTFVFQNRNHAILFKTTWAEYIVTERNSVLQD